MRKYWNYVTPILLLTVIFGAFLANMRQNKAVIGTLTAGDVSFGEAVEQAQTEHKEQFPGRNELIDISGAVQHALGKRIVGNFEFAKDDHGVLQVFGGEVDYSAFLKSMTDLNDYAQEDGTALVYLMMPDKVKYLSAASSGECHFEGQTNRQAGELIEGKVDCLDLDEMLGADPNAPAFDDLYFRTDVHCTTYAEMWMAKETVDHLTTNYGLSFYNADTVFDLANYSVREHEFLGNTARSVGGYYTGLDRFDIYAPLFETDLSLYSDSGAAVKTGNFEEVALNGYENNDNINIDKYIYWVTDFGNYTSPRYTYRNNAAPSDAPNVLVICDSVFMRGFSYLSLACRNVTVLDPRFFNGTEYLANELALEHYDAIIVVGSCSKFYISPFQVRVELPALPTDYMISSEEYGQFTGNQGIWVDNCNDVALRDSMVLQVAPAAQTVKLDGWAADFRADAPFQALYLRVGDTLLQCDYQMDRPSVVDFFQKETLLKTGFQVTFPASLLRGGEVTEVSFIGVSADGARLYSPASYQIAMAAAAEQ